MKSAFVRIGGLAIMAAVLAGCGGSGGAPTAPPPPSILGRMVNMPMSGLAVNPAGTKLVTIVADDPVLGPSGYGNAILNVDIATGQITSVPTSGPASLVKTKLASYMVSQQGNFVQPLDLSTGNACAGFSLGNDSNGKPYRLFDMDTSPLDANVQCVHLLQGDDTSGFTMAGVQLYDHGAARPKSLSATEEIYSFTTDGARLIGVDGNDVSDAIVDANGLTPGPLNVTAGYFLPLWTPAANDAGRLYLMNGAIVDQQTGAVVGALPNASLRAIEVVPSRDRVYGIGVLNGYLYVYQLSTLTLLETRNPQGMTVTQLTPYGAHGLALGGQTGGGPVHTAVMLIDTAP